MRSIARNGLGAFGLAAALLCIGAADAPKEPGAMFHNPVFTGRGQDPSILHWNGNYYLVQSQRGVIRVYRSRTLTGLRTATGVRVFWSNKDELPLSQLWAPEITQLDGKFYIYFAAATNERHESRRMYVLESDEPTGPYTFRGKITDTSDQWAIDGSVIEHGGKRYFVWSGWQDKRPDMGQQLYIAPMANPWTITGERRLLSSPDQPWERIGPEPINEGAQQLSHDGRLFIVYSASHSFTDDYCLGLLTYDGSGEITDRRSWTKSNGCVFSKNVAGGVYGPGHNILVPSPDGRETWNVYHAVATSGCGWNCRTIRMQPVRWRADGTPDFGIPIPLDEAIPVPSGEPGSRP
ncbi:family 43 glycosylhydrolase [Hephaestia sp. GCM10023244]|nr:glycoside hydrolase family 43 protein [Hephaestia sp. MAHUQ-44]